MRVFEATIAPWNVSGSHTKIEGLFFIWIEDRDLELNSKYMAWYKGNQLFPKFEDDDPITFLSREPPLPRYIEALACLRVVEELVGE